MASESVLITGTTSGVGRALLEYYVARGARVISVNRRAVPELQELFPEVRFEIVDVRAAQQVTNLVHQLAATSELPQVLFLNAGINRVDNDEWFELETFQSVMDTNLYGVLHFVEPLTKLPPGPVVRHVVAISSMTHYVGNPYGLGYFISKRGLTSCFEVWSRMYAGTDLVFQQVLLGPVRTAIYTMSDRLPPWMVWVRNFVSGSLLGAVAAIASFSGTRRRKLFYPLRALPLFVAMCWAQALIPGFFQGKETLDGKARR